MRCGRRRTWSQAERVPPSSRRWVAVRRHRRPGVRCRSSLRVGCSAMVNSTLPGSDGFPRSAAPVSSMQDRGVFRASGLARQGDALAHAGLRTNHFPARLASVTVHVGTSGEDVTMLPARSVTATRTFECGADSFGATAAAPQRRPRCATGLPGGHTCPPGGFPLGPNASLEDHSTPRSRLRPRAGQVCGTPRTPFLWRRPPFVGATAAE
jgi:hypothetical protein